VVGSTTSNLTFIFDPLSLVDENRMNNNQTSLAPPSAAVQDTRPIRILRRWQVQDTVGLSRATIYQMMREGRFPKPVKISVRAVGWIEHEIQEWLMKRVETTHSPPLA
jgi:prophage regulatory protein